MIDSFVWRKLPLKNLFPIYQTHNLYKFDWDNVHRRMCKSVWFSHFFHFIVAIQSTIVVASTAFFHLFNRQWTRIDFAFFSSFFTFYTFFCWFEVIYTLSIERSEIGCPRAQLLNKSNELSQNNCLFILQPFQQDQCKYHVDVIFVCFEGMTTSAIVMGFQYIQTA